MKYFREFGWEPCVITGPMGRRDKDHSNLTDIPPDQQIVRLPAWCDVWPGVVARRVARCIANLNGRDARSTRAGLQWRFQREFNRFSFPDRHIWRMGAAIQRIVELHRRRRFDAIFSSGMPFSDHVIAMAAQAILRVPWIADFRDPWAEYVHGPSPASTLAKRLTAWAEAAVVRRATRVVSVNDAMTARFRERYRGVPTRKFITVENGFDPADFEGADQSAARGEFRLLHAGSFYGQRSPATLVAAFQRFVEQTPGSDTRARLLFAGRLGEHATRILSSIQGDSVRLLGMLPHQIAARATAEADVNVVILPNVPGGDMDSTAKIYECLGSGRPLLALVPANGAAAKLLAGFDGVWRCNPDDVASTAAAIRDLYRHWLMGTVIQREPTAELTALTRRNQTQRLAETLNAITHGRRASAVSRTVFPVGGFQR